MNFQKIFNLMNTITKIEFNKLFNSEVTNQNLYVTYSVENEELISEISLNSFSLGGFNCFSIYDNRIYINCELDLDINLLGIFDSIDGETRELTIYYISKKDLLQDLKNLLSWYDSNF